MAARVEPHSEQYRLIITRRSATEVLLSTELSGPSLPRLRVHLERRPALQLVAGAKTNYQIATYCLFVSNGPTEGGAEILPRYAVLEAIQNPDQTPPGTRWLPAEAAQSDASLTREDQAAIRHALDVIEGYVAKPETGHFARPDSIETLFAWVREQIEPLGVGLTGGFEQLNAGPAFTLLRIETTRAPRVWFKAAGEPNRHELPITMALDRFFPDYVPRILAVHRAWNGWLSEDVPGRTIDALDNVGAWAEAASALAKLQIASIARTAELLESGCKDLRLVSLVQQIDPFLRCMNEFMAMQTKQPPEILTPSELHLLGDRLRAGVCKLEQYRIPSTLGHLDLNPGNILVSPFGCRFLDWAEGCVVHPFVTFEYLREHARRTFAGDPEAGKQIVCAYTRPWQSLFSPETLTHAMALTPLVAVFVFAVAGGQWCSRETAKNPRLAGYFRSLTRRAYRESARITPRSDRCLA